MCEPPGPSRIASIRESLPYWAFLAETQRQRLAGLVNLFLHDVLFEGCAGLCLREEMRVAVAAHACVPLLGMQRDSYPSVSSVLLYPAEFVALSTYQDDAGIVTESQEPLIGEAGELGAVVLSWADVSEDSHSTGRGRNVVIHEFAHVLDGEAGGFVGVPRLENHAQYERWVAVLTREYERLARASGRRPHTVIDEYGATDPAEFFAVATETFFDAPRRLYVNHRALYEVLAAYYNQEPAHWVHE